MQDNVCSSMLEDNVHSARVYFPILSGEQYIISSMLHLLNVIHVCKRPKGDMPCTAKV